jgi:hypothetical protein
MKLNKDFGEEWPSKPPFIVPDGYFETFPEKLMARIESEKLSKKKTKVLRLQILYAAAAIFFLALAGVFTYKIIMHKTIPVAPVVVTEQKVRIDSVVLAEVGEELTAGELTDVISVQENQQTEGIYAYLVDSEVEIEEIISEF